MSNGATSIEDNTTYKNPSVSFRFSILHPVLTLFHSSNSRHRQKEKEKQITRRDTKRQQSKGRHEEKATLTVNRRKDAERDTGRIHDNESDSDFETYKRPSAMMIFIWNISVNRHRRRLCWSSCPMIGNLTICQVFTYAPMTLDFEHDTNPKSFPWEGQTHWKEQWSSYCRVSWIQRRTEERMIVKYFSK